MSYIHSIPGRLRVRTPRLKRNSTAADALCGRLRALDGVRSAEINVVTGSITIHYDTSATGPESLLAEIRNALGIELSLTPTGQTHAVFEAAASRAGQRVARVAATMVFEKVLERSAVALIGALV